MANRLAFEKSLYLRQHADNPVNWFPFGKEAFEKAGKENKPLFISIGYSSCHWCHVMEEESFQDEEVARILNSRFVPVKVDREELPHVDRFYMEACRAMGGSCGWPLSVFATPEGEPFFIATYGPKERFKRLLLEVAELWEKKSDSVVKGAKEVVKRLASLLEGLEGELPGPSAAANCFKEIESRLDPVNGGYSPPPKFPLPHFNWFLLRYFSLGGSGRAFESAAFTLKAMRLGSVYDQIGGGFHRYSTDAAWFVPHFEKMLYDQAGLLVTYSEAYALSGYWLFKETVKELISYLERELLLSNGLFASSQDADSPEGEGRYYAFTWGELKEALTPEELEFARQLYNLSPEGNWEEGLNLLYPAEEFEVKAEKLGLSLEDLLKKKALVDSKLLSLRGKKVPPATDEKALTDWNGYLLWGLAVASRFVEPAAKERAVALATSLLERSYRDGKLYHVLYGSEPAVEALLDDYAFLIRGLLELGSATLNDDFYSAAAELADIAVKAFYRGGRLYGSSDNTFNLADPFDGAYPSGVAVMVQNLLIMSELLGLNEFKKVAENVLRSYSEAVNRYPSGVVSLVEAVLMEGGELSVVESASQEALGKLLKEFRPYRFFRLNPEVEGVKVCERGVCREIK
jgi:uncharacterized protein YyaL (SSP411 family)